MHSTHLRVITNYINLFYTTNLDDLCPGNIQKVGDVYSYLSDVEQ